MKKYIKLIAANLCIVLAAVILYSPGLLALRVTDYSILRAGLSILAAPALIGSCFLVNIRLLKGPSQKPLLQDDVPGLESVRDVLKNYNSSRYLKNIAATATEQAERILKSRTRLSRVLEQKFTKGTMSWDKFYGVMAAAEDSAMKNVVAMANRMQLFDEKEYTRLQHYKEDTIPDDIQLEQLRLYQKNFEDMQALLTLNEKILLKLNTLTMEVSSSTSGQNESANDGLLREIEKLIDETKYYQ